VAGELARLRARVETLEQHLPDDARSSGVSAYATRQGCAGAWRSHSRMAATRPAAGIQRARPRSKPASASPSWRLPAPEPPARSRGNIRGNIQIVHCVHSVQKRGRSGRYGRIGHPRYRVEAWSGITGWRFESCSAHLSEAPRARAFVVPGRRSASGGAPARAQCAAADGRVRQRLLARD
jgi:hypothetical protein